MLGYDAVEISISPGSTAQHSPHIIIINKPLNIRIAPLSVVVVVYTTDFFSFRKFVWYFSLFFRLERERKVICDNYVCLYRPLIGSLKRQELLLPSREVIATHLHRAVQPYRSLFYWWWLYLVNSIYFRYSLIFLIIILVNIMWNSNCNV